jgi:hypothetical protein
MNACLWSSIMNVAVTRSASALEAARAAAGESNVSGLSTVSASVASARSAIVTSVR